MNVLILGKEQDAHKYKSYLTADFPEVNFFSAREESEVGDFIEKADVLVCLRISDELLSRAKNLKWIQCIISGTNYIEELPSFQARKEIILTSSRGIHGPQLSELCIMFMIAMNRKFPQFVRNQDRRLWDRWPTSLLLNKKVGILGVGVIGEAIARKCKAFEMTVLGIDVIQRKVDAVDVFYGLDGLSKVASEADYFVSVVPATPENEKMLNAGFFSRMKPTAFFISLGRGEVVDEDALMDALREQKDRRSGPGYLLPGTASGGFPLLGTGQCHHHAARRRDERHLCPAGGQDLSGKPAGATSRAKGVICSIGCPARESVQGMEASLVRYRPAVGR